MNGMVEHLNILIRDKQSVLAIDQSKMSKLIRNLFWEHRQAQTAETKGRSFVTEHDLREHGWSKSKFTFNSVGRTVITILRHLGRIREVRGGGKVRIVVI